jgi:signal transduction histidine kinase
MAGFRDAFLRWRSLGILARDAIGTAVFAIFAFAPALASNPLALAQLPVRHGGAFALVLDLAQVVPLAGRRRWPAWCLAVVGVGFAAYQCLGYPGSFSSVGLIFALYAAGAHQQRHRRLTVAAATAGYAALAVALAALHAPERGIDYVSFYLVLAGCWGAGALVRSRQLGEAARRRLEAAQAVTAERTRIARELHDVITHHVTAMVMRAGAAQYLPAGDVGGELGEIASTGRQALADLRSMLNLLDTAGADEQPTFAAGRLRDLVKATRQAGQPVSLIETGVAVELDGAAALAAYRVVQESLTNALKHAFGGETVVRVSYSGEGTEIDVTTDGPVIADFAPGRGLTGLRERVAACGGSFAASADPGGGFRVHARMPAGPAASATQERTSA